MYKKENNLAGIRLLLSMRYLLRELCSFRWYSVLLPFLGCLSKIFLSLIMIYMPKVVLDAVEQRVLAENLAHRVVGIGCSLAVVSIADLVIHNAMESCSQNFLYTRLTVLWEQKVMSMDYESFISNRGKVLIEKARQAVCSPNWGIVKALPVTSEVLEALVGLLTYCGIIGILHPLIVLLLLLIFAIETCCGLAVENKKQQMKEERARIDRRLNYMAYGTKGMQEGKDIRIYSMGSLLCQIAKAAIKDKRNLEEKTQGWQFCNMLVSGFLILLRDGLAYLYLIYRFLNTGMSIGDFSLYFAAITGFGNWLTKLANAFSAFMEANNYVTDFREFMELADEDENSDCTVENLEQPISFDFHNVSFSYYVEEDGEKKEIPVIHNLNLAIKGGEKVAIVGVNGAGKSTFVKLLCGALRPKQGTIIINGKDSRSFRRKDYYSLFAAVFQKSGFLPVSIAENIVLNVKREPDMEKMWSCIRMAGLEQKIKSLPQGADTCLVKHISENGTELSGGEEQRLLLARALYKDAPVLVLDEPTAALDPIAENEIYQKYNEFTKEKTAVFISHRLASTRFCDRIILLDKGTIIESGTHEELMALGGKYAEMFQIQSQYYKNGEEGAKA